MNAIGFVRRCLSIARGCALLGMSLLAATQLSAQGKDEFVIRDVRIFDGSKVISKGQVWVQSGRIKAVGADVKAPATVRTIDGAGETLLPGLIDAHTHAWGIALKE